MTPSLDFCLPHLCVHTCKWTCTYTQNKFKGLGIKQTFKYNIMKKIFNTGRNCKKKVRVIKLLKSN